jgi:hypothetical protein
MTDGDENQKTSVITAAQPFNYSSVPGFESVKAFFEKKGGWVYDGKACWSSRDKMARIQPDGIGYNFEVWQVDGVPQMLYCQMLEETDVAFARQANDAGVARNTEQR